MGRQLAIDSAPARELFLQADAALGLALSQLMWEGPESDLNDTLNTQPALFVHSLAVLAMLTSAHAGFRPGFAAGHSLGEVTALVAAGALSFADGLRLVRRRAELMQRAGQISPGQMAAVLGLEIPALERACTDASRDGEVVVVANDNCPGQVVISGASDAVERAMVGAKAAGAKRVLPLKVSIAAHSPLMNSIQADWDAAVDSTAFVPAALPVIGNVQAKPLSAVDEARSDLKRQMQSRVRWTESIQWLAAQGVTTFLEIGNGAVLTGLVRRILPEAKVHAVAGPADLEGLA
jgi:[acyl-carrier-protein] S-malonyltransferase